MNLTHKYEEEKRKLNELGQRSLEQGIPLSTNKVLQAQSHRVDELINQMYQEKSRHAVSFLYELLSWRRYGELSSMVYRNDSRSFG